MTDPGPSSMDMTVISIEEGQDQAERSGDPLNQSLASVVSLTRSSMLLLLFGLSLAKGQCDRMETSTKEMKRELCELIACKEALTRKYDEESEKCRLLQVLLIGIQLY